MAHTSSPRWLRAVALTAALLAGCAPSSAGAPPPSPPTPSYEPPPPRAPGTPPVATGADDGAACLAAADCASGVCEGVGCGADTPGVCMPALRACTRDLRTYCGCDGATFQASGSCPGQRHQDGSACAGAPTP